MKDYVGAMCLYLLEIDLYFAGNDEETTKAVTDIKKAIDKYIEKPERETFKEIDKLFITYFFTDGQRKEKYNKVAKSIDNLGEMIYRTKKELFKFN